MAEDIGRSVGRAAGGWLGGLAGKAFTTITGMGSYSIKKNSLMSGRPPQFGSQMANGSIELVHSEFISDVFSSVAFTSTNYPINAGLYAGNPFLSNIATNFEQYEFLGLIYQFRSTSASALNSTNTALGTVLMATNYDVLDPAFSNKQQMEAYMFCTSCNPSMTMVHPVECDPRQNALANLYCRAGAIPSGSDQRFYDMGFLQVSTVGQQAVANIGELWVSYHVRLLKPKLPTPLGANLLMAHLSSFPANTSGGATPMGTSVTGVLRAGSTYPLSYSQATTAFTFPVVGRYVMTVNSVGATISTATGPSAIGANISVVSSLNNNANAFATMANAGATTNAFIAIFDVNTAGTTTANQFNIGGFTPVAATGNTDVYLMQISSGVTFTKEELLQLRLDRLEARFLEVEEKESEISDLSYLSIDEVANIRTRRLFSPATTQSALFPLQKVITLKK
jgi:hypothetical protein